MSWHACAKNYIALYGSLNWMTSSRIVIGLHKPISVLQVIIVDVFEGSLCLAPQLVPSVVGNDLHAW